MYCFITTVQQDSTEHETMKQLIKLVWHIIIQTHTHTDSLKTESLQQQVGSKAIKMATPGVDDGSLQATHNPDHF